LLAHLSEAQQQTWRAEGYFDVVGESGAHTYRIHRGLSHNVWRLDPASGREVVSYCAYTPGVPQADVVLAQKLMLAYAEHEFLRVANAHEAVPQGRQAAPRQE
jgi:hypothetical protein